VSTSVISVCGPFVHTCVCGPFVHSCCCAFVHTVFFVLCREIKMQKSACVEIIRSKDDLIRDFQQQLKSKDEEYVKALKQQADDIEDILTKMHTEFRELQEEYEVELDAIESAFMAERDELLGGNKGEIDGLFEKRRAMELAYMDAKQKREEQYQRELDELVVKDAEEYNKLKIKLETDIQTLEQQLEEMRATYVQERGELVHAVNKGGGMHHQRGDKLALPSLAPLFTPTNYLAHTPPLAGTSSTLRSSSTTSGC